jgi:AcrR family transcriptional regulator
MCPETQIAPKRTYRKRQRAEAEEATRLRITEAIMDLHETVGPARTTVSGIAERAGVQRGTVYRHFPDEEAQIEACSTHWLTLHAPPDPTPWAEIADPDERLRTALPAIYDWYAETEPMVEKLYRDAPRVPAIASRIQVREQVFDGIAELLMSGRPQKGAARKRTRAAIGHALGFETWRSLVRGQDLSNKQAVELMAALVAAA